MVLTFRCVIDPEVAEGSGSPSRYPRGWTQADVTRLGVAGAVALFERNYGRLRPTAVQSPI